MLLIYANLKKYETKLNIRILIEDTDSTKRNFYRLLQHFKHVNYRHKAKKEQRYAKKLSLLFVYLYQ